MSDADRKPSHPPSQPLGVLLVDDDVDALLELAEPLSRRGILCESTHNAENAIHMLKNRSEIGVILTDLRMPKMSGFKMIDTIRASAEFQGRILRFIIITANADVAAAQQAIKFSAVDFISKPAKISDVIDAIERARSQILESLLSLRRESVKARWYNRSSNRSRRLYGLVQQLGAVLQKKIDAKGANYTEFLRRMSHEFRTPLHQIIGLADVLQLENKTPDPEYIQLIHFAAKDLLSLVDGLLDIKNADQLSVADLELRSVSEVVTHLVQEEKTLCSGRSVTVNLRIDGDARPLLIDKRFAAGALRSVLKNAICFAPPHTTVELHVETAGSAVLISVTDAGIGMSNEQISNAIRPFWQSDQSVTRNHNGAGLGLTLASLYMDLLGGDLNIESVPERGTTVTLTVPYRKI